MKRTSGLCLTAGLILAVVFLFQLSTSASDKASPVTFTKDVASILHKNCASCHRAGEIAPMSLVSFKDVRPWAKSIREVVVERRMPPGLQTRDTASSLTTAAFHRKTSTRSWLGLTGEQKKEI